MVVWQSLNSWLSKAQQQKFTFDKGGKCGSAERGIARFLKGWCGARDYCPFARVVGMEGVDATEAIPPS